MSDRAGLAVRDSSCIEVVVKGASRAGNRTFTAWAVATGRARHEFEVGRPRLTVVTHGAIGAATCLSLGAGHSAEFARGALGLNTANAVGTARAKVMVGRDSSHFGAEETVWAGSASRLTPSTVGSLLAHLDVIVGVVDAVTFGNG